MPRLLTSSQELMGQCKINVVCIILLVRRQEIVNFMTPPPPQGEILEGGGGRLKSVKLMYLKKKFFTPGYRYLEMMTKAVSTKFINIMIPRTGVLVLGCGYISHIVKMHVFLKIFFSSSGLRSDQLRE